MTDVLNLDAALKILEIVSIVCGGSVVVFKLGRVSNRVEEAIKGQAADISELKEDMKVISKLLIEMAVQKSRIDSIEKRVDELRHGEGFVYPIGSHLKTG